MKTEVLRKTKETEISLVLEYPGTERKIETGCGFITHMIDLMCHRAGLGITIKAKGDIEIDYHHLAEDLGISLGQALRAIAKESGAINRYGWSLLPMDGSLARVALDFSGRGGAYFKGSFPTEKCGDFDMELIFEFFLALAREGGITLHIGILEADNSHHIAEAIFKGVGIAIRQALCPDSINPSTKGKWL